MALKRRTRTILAKAILFLPLFAFLLLALFALQRGGASPWRDRCAQFVRQSEWRELTALAENLNNLRKPDTETLFWGLLASTKLGDKGATERFAGLLLHQRALNWRIESETAKIYQPSGRLDRLLMYRARSVLVLMLVVVAVQTALLFARRDPLPWTSALAVLGCILLLA